jgi:septal ring factor EnvC (AmiA/AmiB activator)
MRSLLATCLLLLLPASASAGSLLTQTLRRETTSLATLESLSDWIVRGERELDDARARRSETEVQIGEASRRMRALEQRSLERRHHLRSRLRALYKLSRGGAVRLFLEAIGTQDLLLRLSIASRVLRRDVRELELYGGEHQRLEVERGSLERARRERQAAEERLSAKQTELQRARREQLKILARLQLNRRQQQRLAGELDRQQRALLARISTLAWQVRTAGGFAARRGSLPRPVQGPIAAIYGGAIWAPKRDERGDGARQISLLRHGITFRPAPGAMVRAVDPGTVRVAGTLAGYGRLVLVEHLDGYFTAYGFLAEVAVAEGDTVRRGTPLGRAGVDPLTGARALYFELRHGPRPLDPVAWIRR